MDRPGLSTITPFADFQPGQFLDMARQGGFTPAGAMKLYDDIRRFGHNSVRREPVNEADALWDQVRLRHCDRLNLIRTPEDFQDYLQDADLLITGQKRMKSESSQALLNHWLEIGNGQRLDRDESIRRFSGVIAYDQSEQWKSWDDMGMEWDDLEAAIGHDIMAQPGHEHTGCTAIEALQEAVEISGLGSVEWQAASGVEAFAGDLAGNITQANHDLQKRTGWEGGVLGLSGRITLRPGMENSGGDGWCCAQTGTDRCWIETSSRAGWGVVSHEWMHGLDFAMGFDHENKRVRSASSSGDAETPWQGLISNLRGARSAPELGQVIGAEMVDGFKRRWTAAQFPDDLPDLLEQLRLEREGRTELPKDMRSGQLTRIKQCLARNGGDADFTTLRAEMAMAEMDLLADHEATINNAGSIWIQFADRFRDNIVKHHPKLARDYANYFQSATEQAAHSFEATFGPEGSFITDIMPETAPLRYPLAAEAIGHKLAWQRMFKAAAPWWNDMTAASNTIEDSGVQLDGDIQNEPTSLAARLSMRAEAAHGSSTTRPVFPATP